MVTKHATHPSIVQCSELMDEFNMLENIRVHSHVVSRVAMILFEALNLSPNPTVLPDKELLVAGGLLHDIAKTQCITEGCNHAEVGAEICRAKGYPEIAEIVREHVILRHFSPSRYRNGNFSAKELINYADKRVLHDTIVSLDERLEYILARYGQNDPNRFKLIRKNFSRIIELEKWICQTAGKTPENILNSDTL